MARTDQRLAYLERATSDAGDHVNVVDEKWETLMETVSSLSGQVTDLSRAVFRSNEKDGFERRLADLQSSLDRMYRELRAKPYTSRPNAGTYTDGQGRRIMGYRSGDSSLSSYRDFEDTFRGSEDFIEKLLSYYLPYLTEHAPVLDIGSGRGELLQLLAEAGIEASGVDTDPDMVARCREKGLPIEEADGIEVIEKRPSESLGAITAIQVAEHLDVPTLERLVASAAKSLKPGGALLLETVNPHSPAALKAFWIDITHVRPLYPESLLTLTQQAGFRTARVLFPEGTGDLETDLFECGSYAILAHK
ncbi:MAG TPA: class I SAM-dependent methyltransferase [Acidimicrobiales bacterium]|nr:class I SAM-dependent methyltransferase [Acidimicrobiales bacterium]